MLTVFADDPVWVPIIYMYAPNCLPFQFLGILLSAVGSCTHMVRRHTLRCTHIQIKVKEILLESLLGSPDTPGTSCGWYLVSYSACAGPQVGEIVRQAALGDAFFIRRRTGFLSFLVPRIQEAISASHRGLDKLFSS